MDIKPVEQARPLRGTMDGCSARACSAESNNCSGRVYSAKPRKIRKSIRLKEYDYSTDGAYFVTICTDFKKDIIKLNEKLIIEEEIHNLPSRFYGLQIDYYVIMPTHIHIIFLLNDSKTPLYRIVQAFKSITTLRIKKSGFKGRVFWQKNYYEHVIRNEKVLNKIREYIINNPLVEKIRLEDIYESKF
ncbi:MAG: transposase [candidate division WOR-3 bacterium]